MKNQILLNDQSIANFARLHASGCLVHVIHVVRDHMSLFQHDSMNCGWSTDFQTEMAELWMVASVAESLQKCRS